MDDIKLLMSDEIGDLATALSTAQAEYDVPKQDSKNPHFGNEFSSLQALHNASLKQLNRHGLSVTHLPMGVQNPTLVTLLLHKSGQWIRAIYPLQPNKPGDQGLGSSITYGKRYSYQCITGIAADHEDDGEVNETHTKPQTNQQLLDNRKTKKTNFKTILKNLPKPTTGSRRLDELAEQQIELGKWTDGGITTLGEKSVEHWQKVADWLTKMKAKEPLKPYMAEKLELITEYLSQNYELSQSFTAKYDEENPPPIENFKTAASSGDFAASDDIPF